MFLIFIIINIDFFRLFFIFGSISQQRIKLYSTQISFASTTQLGIVVLHSLLRPRDSYFPLYIKGNFLYNFFFQGNLRTTFPRWSKVHTSTGESLAGLLLCFATEKLPDGSDFRKTQEIKIGLIVDMVSLNVHVIP